MPGGVLSPSTTGVCSGRLQRRYNVGVALPQREHESRRPKHHIYALETTGLLLIALMLLILTIIRYWHNINWSVR
jgi:hypothetical protein